MNIMQLLSYSFLAFDAFQAKRVKIYQLYPADSRVQHLRCFSYYYLPKRARLSIAAGLFRSHLPNREELSFLSLITDFHWYTSLVKMATSYISTCTSLTCTPFRFQSFSSQLQILQRVEDLTQSVSKGVQGYPARSQMTQLAIAMPMMAGMVPRTGMILSRQLSKTLKESGLSY